MDDANAPQRATLNGLPLYQPGHLPRYLRTANQLSEEFDLRAGIGLVRAYVASRNYGPVALYSLTEAEPIESPNWSDPTTPKPDRDNGR